MSIDRVKERIRALLAVSKDNASTDGEIQNAIIAARNLMHAHNLEENDIPKQKQEKKEMGRKGVHLYSKRTQRWESNLIYFIGEFIGNIGVYRQNQISRKDCVVNGKISFAKRAMFYGESESVEIATELFRELHDTIITMANLQYGVPTKGEARCYAEGFVKGLSSKLKKADELALNSETSRALVVQSKKIMERKQAEALTWLNTQGVKIVSKTRTYNFRQHSPDAFAQGETDGQNQGLSNTRKTKITDQR